MPDLYFPSCNFTKDSPEAARRIRAYLEPAYRTAGCCRTDALSYPEGSAAVYFCQACRETLEQRAPGKYRLQNLFVILDRDPAFPWPDYAGLTVTVQDCWRDRDHPEIFDAVRSCLEKMHVRVLEMPRNRERSPFCGTLHYEPSTPEGQALLAGGVPITQLPEEQQVRLMQEHLATYPCSLAVTCCNRCKKGILQGGGQAVHLLELATGVYAP